MYENKILFIAPDLNIKNIMDNELNSPRIQELLKNGELLGEYRTPVDEITDINRLSIIDVFRVTHKILSFKWDDMVLKGNVELIPNKYYMDFIKPNMESKDMGWFFPRVIAEGNNDKITKLHLITFDYSIYVSDNKWKFTLINYK